MFTMKINKLIIFYKGLKYISFIFKIIWYSESFAKQCANILYLHLIQIYFRLFDFPDKDLKSLQDKYCII